jgi:hypothetical protein
MYTNSHPSEHSLSQQSFGQPDQGGTPMHIHDTTRMDDLLHEATIERLASAAAGSPGAVQVAEPGNGWLARSRRRVGQAVIAVGRSIEGAPRPAPRRHSARA